VVLVVETNESGEGIREDVVDINSDAHKGFR
jgi:hypothetical protein